VKYTQYERVQLVRRVNTSQVSYSPTCSVTGSHYTANIMTDSNKPRMNWDAPNLEQEFHNTLWIHVFGAKSQVEKMGYLMTYIGDKGREIYSTFTWAPAHTDGDDHDVPAENNTVKGVTDKFRIHCAPKKNEIRATVNFNREDRARVSDSMIL
jgi:hypothetical protein